MEVTGHPVPGSEVVLTEAALSFLEKLQQRFGPTRERLLLARAERQRRIDEGEDPDFLTETRRIRDSEWKIAPTPPDLECRIVEITGPAEPKMMINALNSGADVFMADFEDSLSPTWTNVIAGQLALSQAVRRTLSFSSPEGKSYRLGDRLATLVVRPRGWHLEEKNIRVGGKPMSASLLDFGLAFFHNARGLLDDGSGPYFYLPKLESHLEARLWNEVFVFAQKELEIPQGSIRATVLIETILAAFEMDEILYELKDHSAGLNAGRWDYLFSAIKKFRTRGDRVFPDRAQLTMDLPFMRAYADLLVKTCHRRGAHAIGGMAAFIPSRKDAAVNETALKRVREDKEREVGGGFDGTWVAHPDLVAVARDVFASRLETREHQKARLRADVQVSARELLDFRVPGGKITEAGAALNIDVTLQYLDQWLKGTGAVAIHNLMEDAATAEISRAQLWQWIRHGKLTPERYLEIRKEIGRRLNAGRSQELLDGLVLSKEFPEFLTVSAYAAI